MKKSIRNLAMIEGRLNQKMQDSDFQREFFKDPYRVLSSEGIHLGADKKDAFQESIKNFMGTEKEIPGSILVKGSGENMNVIIHKEISTNSANFIWRK